MQFRAGIGCLEPLFCEITIYLVTAIFGGLLIWFIISLIQTYLKSTQKSVKARTKKKK